MTRSDATTPTMHDLELVLVPRLHVPAANPRLTGRISLGTPVVQLLTAEAAAAGNVEWRSFLEAEATHSRYIQLSLLCSFRAAPDGDPIVDAAVGIQLEAPAAAADRQPIAWSISPKRRSHPANQTGRITMTAKLAIVESTVEYGSEQNRDELFVVGMGERDSDPEWRFRAVSNVPLIGDEEITVIVKAPAGVPAQANVSLAATIKQRRLGLIPYRAELPNVFQTIDLQVGEA